MPKFRSGKITFQSEKYFFNELTNKFFIMRNLKNIFTNLIFIIIAAAFINSSLMDSCYAQSTFYKYYWKPNFLATGTLPLLMDGDYSVQQTNNLLMFISFASPKETNQRKREKKRCSLPHIAQRQPFFQASAFYIAIGFLLSC